MQKTYRIGTRKSTLALKQVDEILSILRRYHPSINTEIVGINTYGDKDRSTPISDIEASDFFTREIDKALLRGDIDFAIHSAKDLPDNLNEGLMVAFKTPSIDPYDVLVSKRDLRLDELPYGARIATSSQRRKEALKRFRPDLQIVDIRGNIEERLKLLDEEPNLDGIVIAAAGLIRLGLENRITQRLPFRILRPHPLQGCLAIVTRRDNSRVIDLIEVLNKE